MTEKQTYLSDFLIIGSGIAGLTLALKSAEWGQVTLITKAGLEECATEYAQGGLAAVVSPEDSLEEHVQDTLACGAGLCREEAVRQVIEGAPARMAELVKWGVHFSPGSVPGPQEMAVELGLEGGHSHRRILHIGDYTGHAVEHVLAERARAHPRIKILEHHFAIDLITRCRLTGDTVAEDACAGAYVLEVESGRIGTYLARATALCTGGAGKVYLYTSNPDIATGDGMAMAYRAGAVMANMEFVQFHPTCLYHPQAKNFLLSEALRGEGAMLKTRSGDRFMPRYDPRGELAPRDGVARAIDSELKRSGDEFVLLDISHRGASFLRRRFPKIIERCATYGLDLTTGPIPVVPAAHYFCGGVQVNLAGQTALPCLAAVGEVSCTGVHGANRLASNSLTEALVYAHATAQHWQGLREAPVPLQPQDVPPWNPGQAKDPDELVVISQVWEEVRRFMWNYVGIARTTKRLERALRRIDVIQEEIRDYYWNFRVTKDLLELRNIAVVAELVVRSALSRRESRGLHFNADVPERDDDQGLRETLLRRDPTKNPLGGAPS